MVLRLAWGCASVWNRKHYREKMICICVLQKWDIPHILIIMAVAVKEEYEAKLDEKSRLVIRGADARHFHVKRYTDGSFKLEPRFLVSAQALKQIERSVKRFKSGKKGKAVNLDEAPE